MDFCAIEIVFNERQSSPPRIALGRSPAGFAGRRRGSTSLHPAFILPPFRLPVVPCSGFLIKYW